VGDIVLLIDDPRRCYKIRVSPTREPSGSAAGRSPSPS
jgi:hypothetical protein